MGKAIRGNLGDLVMSRTATQLACSTVLVESTISMCEGLINALWGVGEAHSVGEGGECITLPKRRSLAFMRGCFELWNEFILLQRSRRFRLLKGG